MLYLDLARRATLIAALTHYADQGMGEPAARPDHIHALATADDEAISLDDSGVRELLQDLQRGSPAALQVPPERDQAAWAALARRRGWPEAVDVHARFAGDYQVEGETVVEVAGGLQLRAPAYPNPCSYVRVVDAGVGRGVELAYWDEAELQQDPAGVLGALIGLLKWQQPDLAMQLQALRTPLVVYERTATEDEMVVQIASTIEGEPIVDPAVAREVVATRFPRDLWAFEATNGNTNRGYYEWALGEAEAQALDVEQGDASAAAFREPAAG